MEMCGNSNSRRVHWSQSAAASSFVISGRSFCDGQAARCHTEALLLKWNSLIPTGINKFLTLLLSLSQVEKPLLSLYWSPKNQVSLSPIVFTICTHDTDNMTHLHVDLQKTQTTSPRSTYLVKELFASGAGQDGKLQLSIHGCYSNIYLPEKKLMLRLGRTLSVLCHLGKPPRAAMSEGNCNHCACSRR